MSTRVSPNMLRVLYEIDEGATQFAYHDRRTIWALMARNLILPPSACGGRHSGAVTATGKAVLLAAATRPCRCNSSTTERKK